MKRVVCLLLMCTILIGCSSHKVKHRIYGEEWDGNPIIVEHFQENEDAEIIHEIMDESHVKALIKALTSTNWQENVEIDIRAPDYIFTWNTYEHHLWESDAWNKLEVSIAGESNYGILSEEDSAKVLEIITGKYE